MRIAIRCWKVGLGCAVSLLLCGLAVAGNPEGELRRFESTQPQMGVPFKIILYVPDEATAKGAFEAAFSRIAELNKVLSDYDPESELSRLSHASPTTKPIAVSDPLWLVLKRSDQLSRDTDGAFDVTVGPYVRLWRRARRSKEMPSPQRMAEARDAVGYQHLTLSEADHTVALARPNMRLDLGGIAMGYAVDEALKVVRDRGITRALVDGSGDIAVGDPPPGKPGWTIGIVPLSDDGTPSRQVLLSNAAVSTAGDAFQHVTINGKRYSHIVDPRTGLGLTDQTGVAVIAPDCLTADSLDTAVNVLGPKAGLELIERTTGAAGFIVRANDGKPETFQSSRFADFLAPADSPVKK